MQIKSTHRLEFSNGTDKFLTAGGNVEQDAPDWIAEDDYFNAAEREGKVTPFAPYVTVEVTTTETVPTDPVVEQTPVVEPVATEPTPAPVQEPAPVTPEKPKRGKAKEESQPLEPVEPAAPEPTPAPAGEVVETGIPGF